MDRREVLALLPVVGAERMETPAVRDYIDEKAVPKRCVVVQVNMLHLWYMVEFMGGIRECFKVPKAKPMTEKELVGRKRPDLLKYKTRRKK